MRLKILLTLFLLACLTILNSFLPKENVERLEKRFVKWVPFQAHTECDHGIKCPSVGVIEHVKNGYVSDFNGLVYDDNGINYSYGYWFWNTNKIFPKESKHMFFKALTFVRIWEDSFQHASMGSFVKARYFCDWILENNPVVIVKNDVQKKIIKHACPINNFFVMGNKRNVFATHLYSIHWSDKDFGHKYSLAASPPNIITMPECTGNVVYYLGRRKGTKRYVINEAIVKGIIKRWAESHGMVFRDTRTEDLTDAALLIGPHGGAFGNVIYSCRNTAVIEFIPVEGLKKRPCYYLLSRSLGLKYSTVDTEMFNFDKGGMVVDTDSLYKALLAL